MIDAWNTFVVLVLTALAAPTDMQFASVAVAVTVAAVALVALTLAGHALAPHQAMASVFARHGAGRAPTPAQNNPAAAGHPRPRAPGYAAIAA